jgi:uncharacterized membrane protein
LPTRVRAARNVADSERVGSVALGAALVAYGVRRRDPAGLAAALFGGAFVLRGATGRCPVYESLGVSTGSADAILGGQSRSDVAGRGATVNARKAVRVERSVMIESPREEVYAFWHDFENLPKFMRHLVSVRVDSATRSHWVAEGPMGHVVEWDAELVNDVPDTLIAWKSVGDADVPNAGSVHFYDMPAGRGTMVTVMLEYEPPGGRVGAAIVRLFGEDPEREVRDDLRHFKELMEIGDIEPATANGGLATRGP